MCRDEVGQSLQGRVRFVLREVTTCQQFSLLYWCYFCSEAGAGDIRGGVAEEDAA